MPKITLSNNYKIDSLLQGYSWNTALTTALAITYSFPVQGSTWIEKDQNYGFTVGEPYPPNTLTYLSETQQNDFKKALTTWSDVANITFTEVSEPTTQGDIRVTFSSLISTYDGGESAAWAYGPPGDPIIIDTTSAGDIWLRPDANSSDFTVGNDNFFTLIHELGHVLGLKHSFSKEEASSSVLTGQEQTTQYTAMSYTGYTGAGYINATATPQPISTPMLYDILAVQYLYGANMNTRTGDDIYTFSNSQSELKTIWDAGGNDTFDASNQTLPVNINLNQGTFSSIGIIQYEKVEEFTAIEVTGKTAVNNIAIAYNTEIENAIGGEGNDTITGTSSANKLTGGKGDDIINGGDGDDTAIFSGKYADYTVSQTNSALLIKNVTEGTDTLTSIEYLQFDDTVVEVAKLQTSQTNIPTKLSEVITSPSEGDSNHFNYFLVQISETLLTDFSVDFTTKDGTAIKGSDYVTTSGTKIIKAGDLTAVIAVEIIGDNISESNEDFSLVLTNPIGINFPTGVTEMSASRTIIDDDSSAGTAMSKNPLALLGLVEAFNETLYI